MSVKDLLKFGKEQLASKNIEAVEAELLLANLLGINRMELHARVIDLNNEQGETTKELYSQAIAERLTGCFRSTLTDSVWLGVAEKPFAAASATAAKRVSVARFMGFFLNAVSVGCKGAFHRGTSSGWRRW